jgi:hypothetical protein
MRVIHFCYLSLLFFALSCTNENAEPISCDGSLILVVDSTTPLTTCAANDGTITVIASGGNGPYQYKLNNGTLQSATTFGNLSTGSYTVTVIDANDCEAEVTNVTLEAPGSTLDFLSIQNTADTDCFANNGQISATGTGGNGTSPYQFALNNGSFSATSVFTSLAPGEYTVKIKDADGCVVSEQVRVTQGDTGISFNATINPIIETSCATNSNCHGSGASSGRPVFNNYTTIKNNAADIKRLTANGSMPPSSSGTLTTQQKQQIACWIDAGALDN